MAELTYNGVTLNFLSTQHVNFEPVYDETAGVDYCMTRVALACTAVITPNVAPAAVGETAAAAMARVSHLLNTPRRGLIFTVGGQTLVSVVAPNGDTTIPLQDAKNGPYPQAHVTRIVGTESLQIQFRVETYVVDCREAGAGPQYTSNRWTEIAEISELAMTRRTRTGRLEVRADLLNNADQLRYLVVPPLEDGFRRLSSSYTLQADGRVLAYQYVDEEQYLMPPNPAAKAEGRFTITSKDGASYWAECSLRLQGGKPTDKAVLMIRAVSIALAKIQSANPPTGRGGAFPVFGSLSEDLFANDVAVHLTAMVQPAKARISSVSGSGVTDNTGQIQGAGLPQHAVNPSPATRPNGIPPGLSTPKNLDWLKIPQEFDGGPGRFDPGDRGTAQLLMIASSLQDVCLRQSVLTATYQRQSIRTLPGQTVPADISIQAQVPDDQSSYRTTRDNEIDGVYECFDVSIRNTEDRNTFALPVGKKDADAAIIQTAAPVARRTVEWKAIKVGGPPRVPKPDLKDTNWVLAKAQIDPTQVEPIADGSVLRFVVAGCFHYYAKSAKKAALTTAPTGTSGTSSLTAAVPPWVDQAAGAVAVVPLVFADDILEPGQSTLTTGGGIIPGVNG